MRRTGFDTPFFILGTQRSGSTMLRLMLDAHPDLAVGPETGFVRAADAALEIPDFHRGDDWYEPYGVTTEQLERRIARFYGGILEAHAASHGALRWGEKTPLHRYHVGTIQRLFPDAQFIGIVRHPASVMASLRQWGVDEQRAIHDWCTSTDLMLRDAGRLGPSRYAMLRYEDLVHDARTMLAQLLTFLGEPWSPRVVAYHRQHRQGHVTDGGTRPAQPIDPSRAWRRLDEVDDATLGSIGEVAVEQMRPLGYRSDRSSPSVPPAAGLPFIRPADLPTPSGPYRPSDRLRRAWRRRGLLGAVLLVQRHVARYGLRRTARSVLERIPGS